MLLCLPCLVLRLTFGRPLSRLGRLIASNGLLSLLNRFTSGVPEVNDVDDVSIYAVHHLVQPVNDNAAVGQLILAR